MKEREIEIFMQKYQNTVRIVDLNTKIHSSQVVTNVKCMQWFFPKSFVGYVLWNKFYQMTRKKMSTNYVLIVFCGVSRQVTVNVFREKEKEKERRYITTNHLFELMSYLRSDQSCEVPIGYCKIHCEVTQVSKKRKKPIINKLLRCLKNMK